MIFGRGEREINEGKKRRLRFDPDPLEEAVSGRIGWRRNVWQIRM